MVGAEEVAEGEGGPAGVGLVGEDRVADVGQVDPDLVGPAGLGQAADEGEAVEPLENLVEGHGLLAAVFEGPDGDLLADDGVGSERLLDVVAVAAEGSSVDQGQIFLA